MVKYLLFSISDTICFYLCINSYNRKLGKALTIHSSITNAVLHLFYFVGLLGDHFNHLEHNVHDKEGSYHRYISCFVIDPITYKPYSSFKISDLIMKSTKQVSSELRITAAGMRRMGLAAVIEVNIFQSFTFFFSLLFASKFFF